VPQVILRERDVEALSGFLEVLAEPCGVEGLRHRSVETIPTVVASALTVWNEFYPSTGEMANPVASSRPGGRLEKAAQGLFDRRAIFAAHVEQQPVLQHYIRTRDGRPRAISDFYTRAQYQGTKLFQEFYGPLGIDDPVGFQLPSPALVIAITLHRGWKDFSQRDRLLLNLMRPQLVQCLHNAHAYERLQRLLTAVEHRVEAAGEGLLLLNPRNHVEYASPNARAILARWMEGWQRPRLPDRLEDWIRDHEPAGHPKAPPWPLMAQRDGRQLTIRRLFVPDDNSVALLVTERDLELRATAVLARLGLTPRQAQVLDLARQGRSNAQIGLQLGISINTVETHMTNALAKLGVQSRTAAANLINQAMNGASGRTPDG
jgi:DNA-binding CsgD family transcriptional regulator